MRAAHWHIAVWHTEIFIEYPVGPKCIFLHMVLQKVMTSVAKVCRLAKHPDSFVSRPYKLMNTLTSINVQHDTTERQVKTDITQIHA